MQNHALLSQLNKGQLCIPIKDSANQEILPLQYDVEDYTLVLSFSSALALAQFCGDGVDYVELPVEAVFALCINNNSALGIDFGEDHGRIFTVEDVKSLALQFRKGELIKWDRHTDWEQAVIDPDLVIVLENFLKEFAPEMEIYYLVSLENDKTNNTVLAFERKHLDQNAALWFQLEKIARELPNIEEVYLWPLASDARSWETVRENGLRVIAQNALKQQRPPILRY